MRCSWLIGSLLLLAQVACNGLVVIHKNEALVFDTLPVDSRQTPFRRSRYGPIL